MKSEQSAATAPENSIDMIPIGLLVSHPDNPRKDLGDLTELAENIRVNGVLQNLTVVPAPDSDWNRYAPMNQIDAPHFRVVIGHRRLAAARLAGLTELPCVIAEKMTPEEQIAVMLSENIQRQALTPYEEAKGFQQLQIDFGKSPKEIAEMAGFHETTVRSRLKLAELDGKKVEKGVARGATLFDFQELQKVESAEAREKCLDAIGTNNFKNTLKSALEEQEFMRRLEKWKRQIRAFAKEIPEPERDITPGSWKIMTGDPLREIEQRFYCDRWTKDHDIEKPDDADTVQYYFHAWEREIYVYCDCITDDAAEKARKREDKERRAWSSRVEQAKAIGERHYELRRDFVKEYGAAKSHLDSILRSAPGILYLSFKRNVWNRETRMNNGLTFLLAQGEKDESMTVKIRHNAMETPEKALLSMLFALADDSEQSYVVSEWVQVPDGVSHNEPHFKDNPLLDELYYLLIDLGYRISDEEQQMRHGTHPLFVSEQKEG